MADRETNRQRLPCQKQTNRETDKRTERERDGEGEGREPLPKRFSRWDFERRAYVLGIMASDHCVVPWPLWLATRILGLCAAVVDPIA